MPSQVSRGSAVTGSMLRSLSSEKNSWFQLPTESFVAAPGDPCVARRPLRPQDPLQRLRRALHEAGQEEVSRSFSAAAVERLCQIWPAQPAVR